MGFGPICHWRGALIGGVACLAGCASLPGTQTVAFDGGVTDVALSRRGPPPIVFENGLAGTMAWWATVFPAVAAENTAFAYNRAGYGGSTPRPPPRDGSHVVEELRALLRQQGLSPPYILVGHSLGGLYMQLYSRRYPDEVAGLVLVDSTHPEQFKGDGDPARWPGWFRAGFHLLVPATGEAEFAAIDATGAELLALPPHTGIPVVILLPDEAIDPTSPVALDADRKRKDMARLNPGAELVVVHAGHGIPRDNPEAVVAAIRRVVAATSPGGAPAALSPR